MIYKTRPIESLAMHKTGPIKSLALLPSICSIGIKITKEVCGLPKIKMIVTLQEEFNHINGSHMMNQTRRKSQRAKIQIMQ